MTSKIHIRGPENKLISNYALMKNCQIRIIGDGNIVEFKEKCTFSGLWILVQGKNNKILIGKETVVNASKFQPTVINAVQGSSIILGDHCLLSNNIEIHSSDYHKIIDSNHNQINLPKDIIIGNHVWIGLRTIILKGTIINDNTIVGAGSLLNSKFEAHDCIIAGNPAKILKKDVNWVE